MENEFLFLSIICFIPSLVIFLFRKDLRRVMVITGMCAIPFAFTESLFYPSYWEPKFLWDLADKIGFGIEDILFVVGLGTLTSSAYAFCFKKEISVIGNSSRKSMLVRLISVAVFTGLLVLFAHIIELPMIYGAVIIMILISMGIVATRKDLLISSLVGGLLTCLIYALICLVFSIVFKNVFHIVWHGEKFSGIFIAGILLEEYLYGFAAGVIGTIFYPFIFYCKYNPFSKIKDSQH